jgi:hypothetical protein
MTATNMSAESIQPKPYADLLIRAKANIEAGVGHLRQAAEHIAAASEQGATQRQIAETVGKSAAWVNGLLKWRSAGYPSTAFGPQAKASRGRVQATKQRRPASSRKSTSAIEVEGMFTAERDQRDVEAREVIARLRKNRTDDEDVMFLCDYIEGTWRRTFLPVIQNPDEMRLHH